MLIQRRISTHWQWVLMVVILIIGFSLLAVVGIWLKRRYDANHQNLYHGEDSGLQPRGGKRGPGAGLIFTGSNSSHRNPHALQHPVSMSSANVSNSALPWGPHQATAQARNLDIAPVEDPAFIASSSRTDLSSLGGRDTPGHGPSRLSMHSGARLHKEAYPSPVNR
jgi:hypothetical protein